MAAGNTTISAVFEGNDTYEAQTVTYTLTINAAPAKPYELTADDYFDTTLQTLGISLSCDTSNLSENYSSQLTESETTAAQYIGDQFQTLLDNGYDIQESGDPALLDETSGIAASMVYDNEQGQLVWPIYFVNNSEGGDNLAALVYDENSNTYSIEIYPNATGMPTGGFTWEYEYENPNYSSEPAPEP